MKSCGSAIPESEGKNDVFRSFSNTGRYSAVLIQPAGPFGGE
jgi:hypothetical protein